LVQLGPGDDAQTRNHRRVRQDGAVVASRNWQPNDEDDYEAASADLKERFGSWSADKGLEVDPEAPESPLHYKWGYLDGHLTRWSCADLDEVYLELYPAKVIVEDDELDDVLEEARAFISFLAETGLLDQASDPPERLLEHLSRIEKQFRANMATAGRQSFGKRLWGQALAEGVSLDDQAGVDAFIARFNARPRAERDALLGQHLSLRQPRGRFTPPGTPPRPSSAKRRKRRR
jgi:hypothetical protein